MSERLYHILEAQQFTRPFLEEELFPLIKKMERVATNGGDQSLVGKRICNLFYEPSTRTRLSFETATHLLGGTAFTTENAEQFSSAVKGESLEDTVRIINGYHHHAIVLRHKEEGAAARAANISEIPVINAGDGSGQHPTQALLDVYTIWEHFGRLSNLRIAMVGDLTYGRTVHSLAYLMAKFDGINIDFVSPKLLGLKPEIRAYLERHQIPFTEDKSLDGVLSDVDVVYLTRVQTERFKHSENMEVGRGSYKLDLQALKKLSEQAIVMHPLPRNDELLPEVDSDPRVVCFRQAQNGLYVRMALLKILLND